MQRAWVAAFGVALVVALAEGRALAEETGARAVDVQFGGTRTVPLNVAPSQINLSDAKVADVKMLPRNQLLLTGRRIGQTEVTVVDGNGRVLRYMVNVVPPHDGLSKKLHALLPGETVKVDGVGNSLVLTGTVSDALSADRAKKLAEAHVQGLKQEGVQVLSLLRVGGRQQVQLRVKIAEVSRSALRQVGVNFWHRDVDRAGGLLAGNKLDNALAPDLGATGERLQPGGNLTPAGGGAYPLPMITSPFSSGAFSLMFATGAGTAFPLSIAVNLLQDKGLAKILSEPTLVAHTGQEAKFLAGGEFPVPIPQALGQTSIEYKKFGVQLTFTPLVLAGQQIMLKLAVSVSEKDQTGGIKIQGTEVPALVTRSSETTVRLKDGQSFAVAGLLQDRIESSAAKIPLLGDLPLVGMVFRRNSFRRQESELVVLVTAHLVQPLSPGEVPPLPGEDELSDPNNFAFFLLGRTDMQVRDRRRSAPAGPIGYTED
jgi:pilus assembly protein CpaC